MRLGTKIIAAAIGSVAVTVVVGLFIQRNVIRQQGIELTRSTMRAAVIEAENVRGSIAALNKSGAFDIARLSEEFKKSGDLRSSSIYKTIPIVAAWEAIQKVAEQEGFEFRVPKHQARNPKNNPTPDEEAILRTLEEGKTEEYFHVDHAKGEIVFARPITLSADCLTCHGNPKHSPTGDGKDAVGFAMEDWKAGEVHGAFVLKAKLQRVESVVRAGMAVTLAWTLPITGLIALGFYLLNRCLIVKPLSRVAGTISGGAEEVASASGHVTSSSQSLAEGASEQAAALEETSSSLEEMSSRTKQNAETASRVKALGSEARKAGDLGVEDMSSLVTAMDDIKASSADIVHIIKTIDEIAFQTNILALNAAVEAARAGGAGAGFAVVADEVRNLAQRCAKAAKETASKIEDAVQKSVRGADISAKVARNLEEIVRKARQVDELAGAVAAASLEQSQGLAQVNIAVSQMDKVTQSNAASAEEGAAAAEELNAQAESMKGAVNELLRLVDGTDRHTRLAAADGMIQKRGLRPKGDNMPKPTVAWGVANGHHLAQIPMRESRPDLTTAGPRSGNQMEDDLKSF